MRPALRLSPWLLFLLVFLLADRPTLAAADPVGTWVVDTTALRSEFERIMRADIARMPPGQRPMIEAVLPGRLDEMVHRSTGTAMFQADGTVIFEGFQGERRTGHWTRDNNRIRLLTEDEPPYIGTLKGDTMRLQPEEEAAAEEFVKYVLRRR